MLIFFALFESFYFFIKLNILSLQRNEMLFSTLSLVVFFFYGILFSTGKMFLVNSRCVPCLIQKIETEKAFNKYMHVTDNRTKNNTL